MKTQIGRTMLGPCPCLTCRTLSEQSPAPRPEPRATVATRLLDVGDHGNWRRLLASVVRREVQMIRDIVDEGMRHVEGGGLRNPGRYANRIVDALAERIERIP